MKRIIVVVIAIVLSLSTLSAQSIGLTDSERAKVATHGDWLKFIDDNCIPIERKISGGQEVVRFRCKDQRAIERVIVFSGDIQQEPYGFAAFKAHLKKAALYTAGGIIFAILLYGKARS